jgi:uncharacterized membrane protein YdbT with pleckstrin-like domain
MSYIDKNLLPDEKIMFRTKKHVVLFLWPLIWTLFALYATEYMTHNDLLVKMIFAPWLIALVLWTHAALEYQTSEFVVTNKRVMMREGFFTRHSNEMRLTAISQVNVDQSLVGQMMNYGTVYINAFGAFDAYTLIASPFQFQKNVNEQLDKAVSR